MQRLVEIASRVKIIYGTLFYRSKFVNNLFSGLKNYHYRNLIDIESVVNFLNASDGLYLKRIKINLGSL